MTTAYAVINAKQDKAQPLTMAWIWLLIMILGTIEVHRLIGIRFTTNDDAMGLIWFQSIWDSAVHEAQRYGRIEYFIYYPLWIFGLRLADAWTYDLLNYGLLVATHVAVFYVVSLYLDAWFAAFCALIYVTSMALVWEYNLFTSYPVINFVAIFAGTLSLALVYAYRRRARLWLGALSLLLLLFSFFGVEFMPILITPIYLICLLQRTPVSRQWNDLRSAPELRLALAAVLVLGFYLAAYFVFRAVWPSTYEGTEFAALRPLAILQTAIGFSVHSSIYAWLWTPYTFTVIDVNGAPLTYSTELTKTAILNKSILLHCIKALIAGSVAFLLLRNPPQYRPGALFAIVAVGLMVMFLPNLIIALTEKYQSLYLEAGRRYYAFTTLSHFGFSLLVGATVVSVLGVSADRSLIQGLINGVVIVLLAIGGLYSSFANTIVSSSMQASSDRWKAVHLVLKTPELRELVRGKPVVGPKLGVRYWRIRPNANYWRDYVKANYDVTIDFQESYPPGHVQAIFFNFFNVTCGGFFAVLAELNPKPSGPVTTRLHFVASRGPVDALLKYRSSRGTEHNIPLRDVFNGALTATLDTEPLDPRSQHVTCVEESGS